MNEKQAALVNMIAEKYGFKPEQIKPETKLGYASEEIATWFVFAYTKERVVLVVNDMENCTVNDLLEQLE